jgi:hypothetical protein
VTNRQKRRSLLLVVLGVLMASGVAYRSHEARLREVSAPQASQASAPRAPFDVEAIVRRVHFAYQPEQDGWRGGDSTYAVKATAQGLTLTPVHHKATEPEALPKPHVGAPLLPSREVETGASLFLGTARVTRGDTRLSVEAPRGKVQDDGHLAFEHGALVEHLRNSEQGVEQSWSFEAAPSGHGDLRFAIPVKGLVSTGTNQEGLHFADARTGLGFRYGHGTWVDGQGRRTAVPAEYVQGQIQLRVPEQVLAESTYPAVLDPSISYERIIDGRPVSGDTVVRSQPSVAFNGTNYLVTWVSKRGDNLNIIYGTRVSSTGTVLDTSGLVVSSGPGSAGPPQVASNGTDFYVVWTQFEGEHWNIRGTPVTGSGTVSQQGGMLLSPAVEEQYSPHVASNGTDYLVTWYATQVTSTYDYNIYARRVSSTGQLLDTSRISIATGQGYDEYLPVVASNGTVYLVAWSDSRSGTFRAYATRVSNAGVVLDGTGFTLSSNTEQYPGAVASNGTNFLVVWQDYRNVTSGDLYGARVTGSGSVVDGTGLLVAGEATVEEWYPSVGSNGTDYLVAWTAFRSPVTQTFQTLGSRVSASASSSSAVVDTTSLVLSANTHHQHPSVAPAGSGYLVVWDGTSSGTTDLYSASISSSGTVTSGGSFAITPLSTLAQTEPVVASNGDNFLVVWTDTDVAGNSIKIYGTRVSPDGGIYDVPGLKITSTANRERQAPSVTSNGTDYFVTWMDYRDTDWDIYGARVLGTGPGSSAVLDPNGFAVNAATVYQGDPVVASNGTDYLVVWRQSAGSVGHVYGARVTSAGVVTDTTPIGISTNSAEHYTPRATFNGTNYFVVWAEYLSTTNFDIHGTRVSTSGSVLDTPSIVISSESRDQYSPDVASNGTDFFVVWTDYRSGSNNDIYGARVSGAGVVQDTSGLALCTATAQEHSPRVTFDGTNYMAAWADYRGGSYWDIYATAVTGSGTVVTSNGFLVADDVHDTQPFVSLASWGYEQSLVVYSRYDTVPSGGSRRIRGLFVWE